MDGSAAMTVGHGQIAAANVIVQYVNVVNSRLHDVNHNPTPYTTTTGSGKAMFFRDGKVVRGTWSRKSKSSGTVWRVGKNQALPHAPRPDLGDPRAATRRITHPDRSVKRGTPRSRRTMEA